jgi:hypothetical protein
VHNNATLSPGIAIRPDVLFSAEADRFSLREEHGIKDIFGLLHRDPFLIWARYQGHRCLCECLAREGAGAFVANLPAAYEAPPPESA